MEMCRELLLATDKPFFIMPFVGIIFFLLLQKERKMNGKHKSKQMTAATVWKWSFFGIRKQEAGCVFSLLLLLLLSQLTIYLLPERKSSLL